MQNSPEALFAFQAALLTDFVVLDASLLIQEQGQFMLPAFGQSGHCLSPFLPYDVIAKRIGEL